MKPEEPMRPAAKSRRRADPWWDRRIECLQAIGRRDLIESEGLYEIREKARKLERDKRLGIRGGKPR